MTTKISDTHRFYNIPATGDSGSSGVSGLGRQIKPMKNNTWMPDINATGFVGHHRGWNAKLKVEKAF